MTDMEEKSGGGFPPPSLVVANLIAGHITSFGRIEDRPLAGEMRPVLVNCYEVARGILDLLRDSEPDRAAVLAYLQADDPLRQRLTTKQVAGIIDGTAVVITGGKRCVVDLDPASTPSDRWLPVGGEGRPAADWPNFGGPGGEGRTMINAAVRNESGNRLIDRIGGEAADELLAGRAAVVPLTKIHKRTGRMMLLEELVYSNKKSRVYHPADRAQLDIDEVRIDGV